MNARNGIVFFLLAVLSTLPQCTKQTSTTKKPASNKKQNIGQAHNKTQLQNDMPQAFVQGTLAVKAPQQETIDTITQRFLDPQDVIQGALSITSPKAENLPQAHMPQANKPVKTIATKPAPVISAPQPGLIKAEPLAQKTSIQESEVDFEVENLTGKTVYVTCFAYMRKRVHSRWRWRKSPVYKIDQKQSVIIDLATIEDEEDRKNIFGILGVFDSRTEAEEAIYELTPDKNKLDLDQLMKLKGKKVAIETERYGFKNPFLEYDFIQTQQEMKEIKGSTPELDFLVENQTKKSIYLCGFTYMKKAKGTWIAAVDEKDDMALWRYDKTPVLRLEQGQIAYIDVDTIISARDRENVLGFLGIFNSNEERLAHRSTYELLSPRHKLSLGNLKQLKNKKIILEIEQYGAQGNIIDYIVKPIKRIDWAKAVGKPR